MTSPRPRPGLEFVALLIRWTLGILFISMGLRKALHPEHFLELVRQYQMVSDPLVLNSIAACLPWFEVFCGLLLLAGVAVRGAALVLVLILVPMTLAVLQRGLGIAATEHKPFTAVAFDCGCGMGMVVTWKKIVENSLLIFFSCWLLSGRGRLLAARFNLFGKEPTGFGASSVRTPEPAHTGDVRG